jgi:2-oxoacid:acceptor oxidoreductase gamma subunit (pyruvate/2-ketoisovalerate family)/2-oxoacid:acceptor oxidoreductase delta subunit (pyruvate/2-ketoisovalerate family)
MLEIRGHARGGQGMVTAFEILAKAFSQMGDYQVQSFPAFGVERTGAPIQAFLRVAKKEILNRSNIYHPHLVVIFDESLLGQAPVFEGLRPEGAVLLNTIRPVRGFHDWEGAVYTVPATQIALKLGLGSKSLPIVNVPVIGAICKIFDLDLKLMQEIIRESVPVKPTANVKSAKLAFEQTAGVETRSEYLLKALHETVPDAVSTQVFSKKPEIEEPDFMAPFWNIPLSENKTGNWRVVTPEYMTKLPPCNNSCPAGTDVRAFVKLTGEHNFRAAAEVIYRHNPFPAICGRVCPNFCEQTCNRNALDDGLNIGAIERYLGDLTMTLPVKKYPVSHKEKIAVIGSGPAGLTAALRLRQKGYAVDVFEALPLAGGMMRSGIPQFRLPDKVLDGEIARIKKHGVKIHLNQKVKVDEIAPHYSAVVTAVGSHVGLPLGLSNDELTTEGIAFLQKIKLFGNKGDVRKGDKIAIIGGGNTAIDVARTALRLGGEPTIYYRRTLKEMPAITGEVEEALTEGVRLKFLTAPAGLVKNGGNQLALTLQSMELGEPDASGRQRPVPVTGAVQTVVVDRVVAATGQRSDWFAFGNEEVKPRQGRFLTVDETPVFGAGDMAWGGTVTEAIGSGNKVAEEVHAHLQGLPYDTNSTMPEVVLPEDMNFTYYLPTARHNGHLHVSKDLFEDFTEVKQGLAEEEVVAETARCLHCGECFSCGNCFNYCPDAAIHVDEAGRMRIDYDYCKGCGICMQECPSSAIQFEMKE